MLEETAANDRDNSVQVVTRLLPSNGTFRGIIFDCDGTLADTMPVHYEAWLAMLHPLGLDLSEERFYAMGGWPTEVICRLLAHENPGHFDVAQMTLKKEEEFHLRLSQTRPILPVVNFAKQYHGQLPMAVATGGLRRVCSRILAFCEIDHLFDEVVTCEDVTLHKPHPDVFLEAARRIGVPPQECLAFEDTDPGMAAIRAAGMSGIDVRTFYTPRRVSS